MNEKSDELKTSNYCLGFIDLLGQRDLFHGQGLLPEVGNENRAEFLELFRRTMGPISHLHQQIEIMFDAISAGSNGAGFRDSLDETGKLTWDEAQRTEIQYQRWSDGLVIYESLGNENVKCPMNGVYQTIVACGSICSIGLAGKQPIRGAIDIAWGTELFPGEIYGPVVSNAYELESEIAQYPRIVVGEEVVRFLQLQQARTEDDVFSSLNRELASLCLQMLIRDADGFAIVHYLGDTFRETVSQTIHPELYQDAFAFIKEQLKKHQQQENSKLALRYAHLLAYFSSHSPNVDC